PEASNISFTFGQLPSYTKKFPLPLGAAASYLPGAMSSPTIQVPVVKMLDMLVSAGVKVTLLIPEISICCPSLISVVTLFTPNSPDGSNISLTTGKSPSYTNKFPLPSPVITYLPSDISSPTVNVPVFNVVSSAEELSRVNFCESSSLSAAASSSSSASSSACSAVSSSTFSSSVTSASSTLSCFVESPPSSPPFAKAIINITINQNHHLLKIGFLPLDMEYT